MKKPFKHNCTDKTWYYESKKYLSSTWWQKYQNSKFEITSPSFEIATNPTIQISGIRARRFNIIDRSQITAIQAVEDENIFNAINAISNHNR